MPTLPGTGLVLAAGGGLTDIDSALFVWTLVLFGLFAFVIGKFGWRPLLHIIEEREKSIREAVGGAERANAEAHELLARHRDMLREAGREREEILSRATREAQKLRDELAARARAEGDQIVQRARDQIERETRAAAEALRSQVADIAVAAAAKIVESSMTEDAQKKLVEDFVASFPRVP
jgi:F-type H+-transporting ATPase subunit b